MLRRRFLAAAAVATLLAGLTACGDDAGDDSGGEQTVTFWHSMAGANGEAVNHLVEEFNKAHAGKIKVEATFQGKYNDSLTKLKASVQSRQTPNLVQVFEIGTQLMVDTKATVAFADLAGPAGIDTATVEPGIAKYYTVGGKLQALPFNASAPMLFYNKTAFKDAGLDPEKPPTTMGELAEAARKLTVSAGGKTTRYGAVASIDGWLVEQMLAAGGVQYCNQDNGRSGRTTAVNWDTPELRGIVNTWAGLVKDGSLLNVGRNNTDASAAFQAGRAAILPFTSANLRDIMKGSKFEVGVANYVRPDNTTASGVFNGGAAVWTMAGHPKAQQAAAAEFLKYLASADAQGYWAAQTGYIPVVTAAADSKAFQETVATYPDFAKPGAELRTAATTAASSGCLMGVMPQARDKMNDIVESVILGKTSADQAITAGQTAIAEAIATYNKSVGQ
ncbi:ABC transporter substrate-binding protein [Dactylosporangium sucinum]|uniref:ABC transporter substrate-binding protein n=1 Tax=Dactylosporangium sucinum TaxID=1424081 RepID=A0A917TSP2_9ACTN|nr:ABC transporter substrate-binding protein [Dactylosporangium sucinum]GGM36100.1 ABC transporter substrate-binding protein [Dactylosporangium sucinum]